MNTQKYRGQWQLAESLLRKLPHDQCATETTQALANTLHELRVYQAKLEAQNTQLRTSYQRLDDEYQHCTHDLYDAVNQSLFSARIISETLLDTASIAPSGQLSHLQYLNAAIGRAIAEMQVLRCELSPERLLHTPLETLLRQLIYSCDHANVTIECHLTGSLTDDVKIAIYRLAQAALTNICQYAAANEIHIQLNQSEKGIQFHIIDNGIGFDTTTISPDSSLNRIRKRVESCGGQFNISSQLHFGTQLTAIW
jgi:signal transduction histidine kinase